MIQKYKGKLITFEGLDGCGKSEQSKLLVSFLRNIGYDVSLLKEPGSEPIAEHIKNILKYEKFRKQITNNDGAKLSREAELLLFEAARANLVVHNIIPALKQGKIVILDRFIDSTYAYQAYGNNHNPDTVSSINRFATKGIIPDITFLIDIEPEVGLKMSKDIADFEKRGLDYLKRVRNGYLVLARKFPHRIKVIPHIKNNIEWMQQQIREHIKDILTRPKEIKFYFATKLAGKHPNDPTNETSKRIVNTLSRYGIVLTKHFVSDGVKFYEEQEKKFGVNILDRDMNWLETADILVYDCNPSGSIGVGREIDRAIVSLGIPVICLYNTKLVNKEQLSPTISHDPNIILVPYNEENIEQVVKNKIEEVLSKIQE